MKKIITIIVTVLNIGLLIAQLPNDCVNSVVTCGNDTLNLDVNGVGTQETTANTCSSGENNSIWLQVTPATSGTLGFTLTPNDNAIEIDFDFFIFGPNVTCGNLGNAIRCSTTNPQAANQGNNLTGMNGNETDTSEGPGNLGNSFVQWLNVNAGDTYYIMIDKPPISNAFNGEFSLSWTGTATFSDTPTNQLPSGMSLNLEDCDDDNDGFVTFDLTQNETQMVNGQDVTTAYFNDISNAQIDINSITIPSSYNGTNNETVYVRLTDNITSCFSVFDINLNFFTFETNTPNPLFMCSEVSISETFNFNEQTTLLIGNNQNTTISYYLSRQDASLQINEIATNGIFINTLNPQEIWYRLDETVQGCSFITATPFSVEVVQFFKIPELNYVFDQTIIYCEDIYPETIMLENIFENNDSNTYNFEWSYEGSLINQTSSNIAINLSGEYSVLMTNEQGCQATKNFHIIGSSVFSSTEPNFVDSEVYYCLNTFLNTITLDVGIENNDLTTFDYDWYFEGNLIAGDEDYTTLDFIPTIPINQIGDYTVNVSNSDGCFVTRTINVLPSEIATFENVLITDVKHRDRVSIIVQVSGQGDYEYGIDLEPSEINNDESYQDENAFDNILYGTHTIYIRDKNGCGLIQKEVTFLEYPKFITPNNDGLYDNWNIDNINAISHNFNTISNIIIFDRFGKIMANINPKGLGWDGNYKGKPAPPSDYWFKLELIDFKGRAITKKGHFVLKRIK